MAGLDPFVRFGAWCCRERNAAKAGPTANSILKVKDKVMNIQCAICKVGPPADRRGGRA